MTDLNNAVVNAEMTDLYNAVVNVEMRDLYNAAVNVEMRNLNNAVVNFEMRDLHNYLNLSNITCITAHMCLGVGVGGCVDEGRGVGGEPGEREAGCHFSYDVC